MSEIKENNTSTFDLYLKIEKLLGIDFRSLGLFRIAIGVFVLIDLGVRATSLGAHYTDAGVVPRHLVFEYGEQPWFLSFHMLSGGMALQILLFLFTAVCAFALMVGYRSRVACFCCWVLMLSLHVRNPFVNNLGDWLLVDLLFWGIFLPIGARLSIDGKMMPADQKLPIRALSIATMAILLQIGFVYFFSVRHKISPVWHTEGTAIQFALNLDRITTIWGQALLDMPESWLQFMSFATLYIEKWGPVLVFVPFFIGPVRTIVACTFMSFHVGLIFFFELGLFPYICIAAWILFLPTWFWDIHWIWNEPGKRLKNTFSALYQVRLIVKSWGEPFLKMYSKPIKVLPGSLETIIGAFGLFCILSSGLLYGGLMDEVYYEKVYKHVEPIVNSLNLKQRWDMFSPQPPRKDGWFVVAAYTEQGRVINLLEPEEEIVWSRPSNVAVTYKNQRWRKYMEWVMNKGAQHADYFGQYYQREYLSKHASAGKLTHVNVYFMQEQTQADLSTSSIIRRKLN